MCLSFRVAWIKVLGTTYRSGAIVVLSVDLVPTFGLISDIIIKEVNNYFIVCEILHTECFNTHYHAYEVSRDTLPKFSFVKQTHLADHSVLGMYKQSHYFVVLKYYIVENLSHA